MTSVAVIGKRVALLALVIFYPFSFSLAQLPPANSVGVTMGQLHYTVEDVDANKKFWIALGGTPGKKLDDMEVVKFPGVVILLSQGKASGGAEGSVLNHVGFRVPSVAKVIGQMRAAGYKTDPSTGNVSNVYAPDGDRVELLQALSTNVHYDLDGGRHDEEAERNNRAQTNAIELHHIHYNVPESSVAAVKTWYVQTFGAVAGHRFHYEADAVPGTEIDILGVDAAQAPIKGRTLNRIGFEVKNLKEFCKELQAKGIQLTSPYQKHSSGVATAEFTDAWGVSIQLTEGLGRL